MGEDSSGGGDALGRFLDVEGYGSGGGGGALGGGASSSSSYMVSSVSKVKSSSSSGGGGGSSSARRGAGSLGVPSPAFRERKTVTSHSGGYDGETPALKKQAQFGTVEASCFLITMMMMMMERGSLGGA